MHQTRTKLIVALAATAVLVSGVAAGRHLIAGSSTASSASKTVLPSAVAHPGSPGAVKVPSSSDHALSATGTSGPAATSGRSSAGTGLPAVPVFATAPQVVHTATITMRVGKGKLDSSLRSLAALAGVDGGYVDSSSLSGGTARTSPVSGTIVIRVPDSEFADAIAKVATLGTVNDQQIKGTDVTVQLAQNSASIAVLQDEVALLEKKLGQATDIGTFLQIQNQLFPVEEQLQRLQSAQTVLENSAALATVSVDLSAPGAPVVQAPTPRPHADAATVAWRYLRHNSLAVLDGLAVAGGFALPVIILLALLGLIALRIVRRRRHSINPA